MMMMITPAYFTPTHIYIYIYKAVVSAFLPTPRSTENCVTKTTVTSGS